MQKIDEILAFEWGTNSSPENLDQGFTHCFTLTFSDEECRNRYLPHPAHKAFGELVEKHLDNVLVFDYWTTQPLQCCHFPKRIENKEKVRETW